MWNFCFSINFENWPFSRSDIWQKVLKKCSIGCYVNHVESCNSNFNSENLHMKPRVTRIACVCVFFFKSRSRFQWPLEATGAKQSTVKLFYFHPRVSDERFTSFQRKPSYYYLPRSDTFHLILSPLRGGDFCSLFHFICRTQFVRQRTNQMLGRAG